METIVNRVALSPLVVLDLEEILPKNEKVIYDLKENLFQELILKEKDFRTFLKEHDWSVFQDKAVAFTCTTDAIIPSWAYMLLASSIHSYASHYVFGSLADLERSMIQKTLNSLDINAYDGKKVVVKGCSNLMEPDFSYVEITRILKPVVKSLMFGEPCSTVPIFKN
jgi:Protein of unknown function (DUF2480)